MFECLRCLLLIEVVIHLTSVHYVHHTHHISCNFGTLVCKLWRISLKNVFNIHVCTINFVAGLKKRLNKQETIA